MFRAAVIVDGWPAVRKRSHKGGKVDNLPAGVVDIVKVGEVGKRRERSGVRVVEKVHGAAWRVLIERSNGRRRKFGCVVVDN